MSRAGLSATTVNGKSLEARKMRRYTRARGLPPRWLGRGRGRGSAPTPGVDHLLQGWSDDRIPLTTAIDSMQPLLDDDLRSMLLVARTSWCGWPKRTLHADPQGGPSTAARSAAPRSRRCPPGRVSKAWTGFWKRAKAAAAVDPYLQVEGNPARPVFVLRKKPLSFADEIQRALKHADHLGGEVAQIREYLERSHEKATQDTILAIAQERIEAVARDGKASHAHILDGILLLEQYGRHPSTSAATELRAMLCADGEELKPEAFDQLATQEAREYAVRLLPEAFGECWIELCVGKLTRMPASVVEAVVQLLAERGHGARLAPIWDRSRPIRSATRSPPTGRLAADGTAGCPALPTAPRSRALLHLARVLTSRRKGEPLLNRRRRGW